jgi:hypothetical protein
MASEAELEQMVQAFQSVQARLLAAQEARGSVSVRLVAVSKTKPSNMIQRLYGLGHRDFGENYVQELAAKAAELPKDIRWHFIGHLQSGKAKSLVKDIPNLAVIETVDSEKVASKLNAAVQQEGDRPPLSVMVQVHTSAEETKAGVTPSELDTLVDYIRGSCPNLRLTGLMTIGAPGDMGCFDTLRSCRDGLAARLGVPADSLELSMGMSGDFEEAVARGSTSVRIGSTIFGARDYSK